MTTHRPLVPSLESIDRAVRQGRYWPRPTRRVVIEVVKQVSRRSFLATVTGLGSVTALSGLGWLAGSCSEDSADDEGLTLDDTDSATGPPTLPTSGSGAPTEDGETPSATSETRPSPTPADSPSETPVAETPTATPTSPPSGEPAGYLYPMANRHVPTPSSQLPNAPRDYRCGFHEGVDFYPDQSGPYFARGTEVWAARDGEVVRADHDFTEYTTVERDADLATVCSDGDSVAILNRLRGRQVWISHDDGNTTRYCHLDSVNSSLSLGQRINAGGIVGGVGNSGTSNGASGAGMDIHLHFELRLGGENGPYLGAGQPESEVRRLLRQLFSS